MVNLLVLLILVLYGLHLTLPDGYSVNPARTDALVNSFNPRVVVASLAAFTADLFVIAVFYQGMRNHATRLPEWVIIGLALTAALWTDALVFNLISDFGTVDFLRFLPGDVAGKTFSTLILWPPTAFYLTRIAPAMPGYVGGAQRRTLDLFFGSFAEVKVALTRTEEALAISESQRQHEAAYFKQIADNISEALWLAEPYQYHAFYVNPAYERIWGRSRASIYADPGAFVNAIHPEDQARVMAGIAAQTKGDYEVEYRIIRPDGTIRWVRDHTFPVMDESGKLYRIAGISEDITEHKALEKQQLELAVEREKVRMLRNFISEASHDLKTPLTSINMKIYSLARTEDPARRQQMLDELEKLSTRMGGMINDLLTLTRLENMGEFKVASLELNRMIRSIVDAMQPQIEDKRLKVHLRLVEANPLMRCDQIDLSRAIANLVDNAVRYTPFGGEVTVATQQDGRNILVIVSDTGIGISPEDLPLIFNRFYRSENGSATDPSGTGLGLAIVKKIVEQHSGSVAVESTLGVGTTFTIRLPLVGASIA